jgi:glycosyltransferase involved in cell wall biosynthesis
MNILIVNPYALAPDQPGGTRHFSLAASLRGQGHAVTLVAATFDHLTRNSRPGGAEGSYLEASDGIPFIRLATPPYRGNGAGRLWNMLAFARRVRQDLPGLLETRPDVVVGSSPHPFGALAALRLSRQLGCAFVLELRDVWPASLTEVMGVSPRHPLVWILGRIERQLYRGADHIVTLLPRVRQRVAERGGNPDAITWVPNGIDLSLVPRVQGLPERWPFTFMYAGSHGVTNALDVLVDAAALLEERSPALAGQLRFVLLGTGPEKPGLEARARRLGLAHFAFRPPVPKRQVYGVLAEADAFWASAADSDLWDFGVSFNKLYDYMAMGRPTLLGMRSPSNPILLSGGGITVQPGSAPAMAEGIERLLAAGPEARRDMGTKARAYVEEHHEMGGLARTFAAALEAALCGSCHAG